MSDTKKPESNKKQPDGVLHFANGSTLAFGPCDVGDKFDGTTYEHLLIDCDDECEGEPC